MGRACTHVTRRTPARLPPKDRTLLCQPLPQWRPELICILRIMHPAEYHIVFIGPWSHKIMYLYSICLVSTRCCDPTISQHKRNTNIHEFHTLPNTADCRLVVQLLEWTWHSHSTIDQSISPMNSITLSVNALIYGWVTMQVCSCNRTTNLQSTVHSCTWYRHMVM